MMAGGRLKPAEVLHASPLFSLVLIPLEVEGEVDL